MVLGCAGVSRSSSVPSSDSILRLAEVRGCIVLDTASRPAELPWKLRFRVRVEPVDSDSAVASTVADSSGCFWIDDLPDGSYDLSIRAFGKRDQLRRIAVASEVGVDASLRLELDASNPDPGRGDLRAVPADACPCPSQSPEKLRAAETLHRAKVVRLPVDVFFDAPDPVRRTLREMGCRIPQTYVPGPRHNLVSGRFLRADELHWAALCSRHESTGLLLLASDGTLVQQVTPFRSDADHLHGIDIDGTPGFNWAIDAVGRDFILEHHARYGGPEPPKIDHDGIDSAVIEKASTVLYWHEGEWLELTGAD